MSVTFKRRAGFTIVELLIVIVVIAILAAISVVAYTGVQARARASVIASDLKGISKAIAMYEADNGRVPCFDHNWVDTRETTWSAPYIKWPRPPHSGTYHWEHSYGVAGSHSISINTPGDEVALALDRSLDDGNLGTGTVRGNGSRLEYYILPSHVTTHPGDDC